MTPELDRSIRCVLDDHYPNPGADAEQITRLEARYGCTLPADMKEFYRACNGASLFTPLMEGPPIQIISLESIELAREAIAGRRDSENGPTNHLAFCTDGDGNWLAIDIAEGASHESILDCFHETYPDPEYLEVVAVSFTDFLVRALASEGSYMFWYPDSTE